jgi:hypothetical protein
MDGFGRVLLRLNPTHCFLPITGGKEPFDTPERRGENGYLKLS